jgi:hypothetical protein
MSYEQREAFLKNPFYVKQTFGDFSTFYITIAVCTVLALFLFVLNIVFGCCSKHREYWQDRHTGNRWIVSLWTTTPHLQPPLDLTELKDVKSFLPPSADIERPQEQQVIYQKDTSYGGFGRGKRQFREEFVELQKRESDI